MALIVHTRSFSVYLFLLICKRPKAPLTANFPHAPAHSALSPATIHRRRRWPPDRRRMRRAISGKERSLSRIAGEGGATADSAARGGRSPVGSPGKSEKARAGSSSDKKDDRVRRRKIVEDLPDHSPGKSEGVQADSPPEEMDERGRLQKIVKKDLLTASPEKQEGVPAESSWGEKDPTPASPGGVPADSSGPAN